MKAIFYPDGSFSSTAIPKIYNEIYTERIYNRILNRKRDLVIVDVGSNIGLTVQYFLGHAKQVYAIEPESTNYEALVKNIEFNGWNNVTPIKAAIAEKDGEMDLNINPTNKTSHSFFYKHGRGTEKVRVITFETLFKENNIEKIDFMKLDIEGYETIVLLGEDFKKMVEKINSFIVEFHDYDFWKVTTHMAELGYKMFQIRSATIIFYFYK